MSWHAALGLSPPRRVRLDWSKIPLSSTAHLILNMDLDHLARLSTTLLEACPHMLPTTMLMIL